MKNIHVLPTNKPSRLYTVDIIGKLNWSKGYLHQVDGTTNQHMYITSNEETKEGDWITDGVKVILNRSWVNDNEFKKIILTSDENLIKSISNPIQSIPDEFLEWFVKNPSCEGVEVDKLYNDYGENDIFDLVCTGHSSYYKIIIPQKIKDKIFSETSKEIKQKAIDYGNSLVECHYGKNTKQETLEEAAEKYVNVKHKPASGIPNKGIQNFYDCKNAFKDGVKWQAARSYSEEDMHKLMGEYQDYLMITGDILPTFKEWFEQFKKK